MKNIKHLPMGLLSLMLLATTSLDANNSFGISEVKSIEIESRVNQMSYSELMSNKNNLIAEQENLNAAQNATQSPSANKAIGSRLKEISAELSQIQKAIAALVGIAAFSAITEDAYSDNVPPVICVTSATLNLSAVPSINNVGVMSDASPARKSNTVCTPLTALNLIKHSKVKSPVPNPKSSLALILI